MRTGQAHDGALDGGAAPLWRRLLWFVGLWLAGVTMVVSFSYLMRWWLL